MEDWLVECFVGLLFVSAIIFMIVFSTSKKPELLVLSPPITELDFAAAAAVMTRQKEAMDELQIENNELMPKLALAVNNRIYSGKAVVKTDTELIPEDDFPALAERLDTIKSRSKLINLKAIGDTLSLFKLLPSGVGAGDIRTIRHTKTTITIKTETETYNFPVISTNPEGLERFLTVVQLLSESVALAQQASLNESSQIDSMSGSEFEKHIAEILETNGYTTKQLGGSGDLGVDIIAEKRGLKYAIQCKRHASMVSRRAVSDAVAGMQHYACDQAVVVTNNTFSPGAVQLAKSNNCILIDRKTLLRILEEKPDENIDILLSSGQ